MNLRVLPAALEHMEDVYGLMCALEGGGFDRTGFERIYEINLSDRNVHYFIAVLDGCAVGFISLHVQHLLHHASLVGEIQELIVSEKYRGMGIGKMLFDAAKKAALDNSLPQMEVCCRKTRAMSRAFYQRMGMALSHDKLCIQLTEEE